MDGGGVVWALASVSVLMGLCGVTASLARHGTLMGAALNDGLMLAIWLAVLALVAGQKR